MASHRLENPRALGKVSYDSSIILILTNIRLNLSIQKAKARLGEGQRGRKRDSPPPPPPRRREGEDVEGDLLEKYMLVGCRFQRKTGKAEGKCPCNPGESTGGHPEDAKLRSPTFAKHRLVCPPAVSV